MRKPYYEKGYPLHKQDPWEGNKPDWVLDPPKAKHTMANQVKPKVSWIPTLSLTEREDGFTAQDLSLQTWIQQAIGAASTCWESMSGTGEFDSEKATAIADALVAEIRRRWDLDMALARAGAVARPEPGLPQPDVESLLAVVRALTEALHAVYASR